MKIKKLNDFLNEGRFYNETLSPKFWNEDKKFNQRIRGKLLIIANDFFESVGLDVDIEDVELTGSLANYNYTEYSDLDVHIIIDFKKVNRDVELVKKLVDNQKFKWGTNHNITIKGHDVELYIQDINEKHTASGLFSLKDNEWIREPKFKEPEIDEADVDSKTAYYIKAIDKLEKLSKHVDLKFDDLDKYFEYAKKLKTKIHSDRKESLETSKAEYSVENLVFKELRNKGYFGKLIDIINVLYDKQFIQ